MQVCAILKDAKGQAAQTMIGATRMRARHCTMLLSRATQVCHTRVCACVSASSAGVMK